MQVAYSNSMVQPCNATNNFQRQPSEYQSNFTMSSFSYSLLPHILLLLSFSTLWSLTATAPACDVDDQAGLLGFKSGITSDPLGVLDSWKPGTNCCATWYGVRCDDKNRVFILDFSDLPDKPNSFLSGIISPSISKLRYLIGIYLINLRNISGPIPNSLFNLPDLQFVYLQNGKLWGPIPENIGNATQLYALGLSGNRLSGRIPSSISKLSQLDQLDLSGNCLTGTIPYGMGQLKNLSYLALDRNRLSGSIPDSFSSFSRFWTIRLSNNKLSGKIPATISALAPTLYELDLSHNALTGQIPDFMGNFRQLDTLNLSWNRLSGRVPKRFINLTKIFNLDLSHNFLVDPFPEMKVKGIESLDLSYNRFNLRKIPEWVTSSPIIYSLKLAGCGIKMKLDEWRPSETYFYDYIDLSDNEIKGSPVQLLNQTEFLAGFWASFNRIRFPMERLKIPELLQSLDLSRNLIHGTLPKNISGLQQLNVSHNHLCGPIPPTNFSASAFVGNDCLCGSPLPPCKK